MGGGVSDIIMHGRVGRTLACYRSMCSVSRRGAPLQPKRLTPGQADPPHFERARAAADAAGEGRHDGHDDLNVAS